MKHSGIMIAALCSLLLGVFLGALLLPGWNEQDHVSAVASSEFSTREEAWAWWRSGNEPLPMDQLNRALELTGPDAFLHGVEQLRRMRRWGWDHQPNILIERHLELLTWRAHVLDVEDAIDLVKSAPLSTSNEAMIQSAESLLAHADENVADDAYRAFVSWAGFRAVLGQILDALPPERAAWALPYRYWQKEGPVPLAMNAHVGFESASGKEVTQLNILDAWMEDTGVEDFVLELVRKQTLVPNPAIRRDTAIAWLQDREMQVDQEEVDRIGPSENRRIAGALLAAHEGMNSAIIEKSMHLEKDARVRTVMRLARDVVGPPWRNEDPGEFARQALHNGEEGDSLYPVACRMMAGDIALLGPRLDLAASGDWAERVRCLKLIAWLRPEWINLDGTLQPLEEARIAAFFDRLLARWHLEHRWLVNSSTTTDDGTHD